MAFKQPQQSDKKSQVPSKHHAAGTAWGNWAQVVQKYFVAIAVAEFVIMALMGWWFVIRPAWQERNARLVLQEQEQAALESKIAAYDRRITQTQEMLETYRTISDDDLKKLDQMVPPQPNLEALFAEIHAIVEQSGVRVERIKLSDEFGTTPASAAAEEEKALPPGVEVVELSLEVSAVSYNSLKTLLRALERHVRLLDIGEVEFSPESSLGTFTIQTYYAPESKEKDSNKEVVPDVTISS